MLTSIDIASSGMAAQSERLKVIAQNIANADSVATTPGGDPYQRKTISFKAVLDKTLGADKVTVDKVGFDTAPFETKYDPGNPVADKDGYVKLPNVSTIIEMTDMREARNAYQANLSIIEITKSMISRTLDLLRI
jgi:flagellar basal-body rod protein FlgC